MASVFWDRKGILLTDFLPRGETTNAYTYCTMLMRLQHAIQNHRRGLLISGVCPLHVKHMTTHCRKKNDQVVGEIWLGNP
jgi:hypothetical protein